MKKKSGVQKTFVLDTNVIINNAGVIQNFEDNDIVIPLHVLKEVDTFKKGVGVKNENAREFSRALKRIVGDNIFNGGVPIGPGKGNVRVIPALPYHEVMQRNFREQTVDHEILNIVLVLSEMPENKDRKIVLISQDTNLCLAAKGLGLHAEEIESDNLTVEDLMNPYKGVREILGISKSAFSVLYEQGRLPVKKLNLANPMFPNEFAIIKAGGSNSALAMYFSQGDELVLIKRDDLDLFGKIKPRNAEQVFALTALLDPKIQVVTIGGNAGTGKTFLATLAGIKQVDFAGGNTEGTIYSKFMFSRQIIPLGKDPGFLPGDIKDKVLPYMKGLYDNLEAMGHLVGTHSLKNKAKTAVTSIQIEPLTHIRGRSLMKSYFIIDETQNLSPHEVKTILTRASGDSKFVFIGDEGQIDDPYLSPRNNGLTHLINAFKDQPIHAHITLEKGERSELADLASKLL
ncbi:MAG: PhoH family protein [Candidatus Pacebacteria bacterium]|nr:PhoH family protein [Candidatus Paceibacterota bacterium]